MEDKYQETCTWTHYKGLLKTKHKNKILKAVRGGKRTYNIQVNSNKNVCLVFNQKLWKSEENRNVLKVQMGRKRSEFYTQRKTSKKLSEIKTLSDKWKLRELDLAAHQDKKI